MNDQWCSQLRTVLGVKPGYMIGAMTPTFPPPLDCYATAANHGAICGFNLFACRVHSLSERTVMSVNKAIVLHFCIDTKLINY